MLSRKIGALEVSLVGLGTNNFGFSMTGTEVDAVVGAALDRGVTFFDTADIYRDSEEKIAAALGNRRDEVVIATKFGRVRVEGKSWGSCARPDYVREAVDSSLRRLRTDRIDLLQLHAPDPETPIAETLGALGEEVAAGKVREIGCSNFSAIELEEAAAAAGTGPRFASVQNLYNMTERRDEADVLPTCARLDIAYLPYWPLASGLLTGKYRRGQAPPEGTRLHGMGVKGADLLTDAAFDQLEALTAWAGDHGHSLIDLAFGWLTANQVIPSVIAGATRPEQVAANAAAGEWILTPQEKAEVDAVLDRGGF
jgi:aryl-alcohol dehydrogenase-like predicted oxidoreductase